MSEDSLLLHPAPRTSYFICSILKLPLWILSVIIPFAIIAILLIPFFDSPIIIVPGVLAIIILVFSFQLSLTLIQWILNWIALIWRGIRRATGAITPTITITPDCFQLNQTLTVAIDTDQSNKIRKVIIQLVHRQTQGVDYGQNIASQESFIGSAIRFIKRVVTTVERILPKPATYDREGRSHKDRILDEQILINDQAAAKFQLTQKLQPLPNHQQHMVLRIKVYSSSLLNYVEYYYLPICS